MQGPKLRVGDIEGGEMMLEAGETLTVKVGTGMGKDGVVYTDYEAFAAAVQPGERLLMDDGKMERRRCDATLSMVVHCGQGRD